MQTSLIIRYVSLVALAAIAGTLGGCAAGGDAAADRGEGRLRVAATTMQVADIARRVGGHRVEVSGLLDSDAEPHDYEPKPSDAAAVAGAEVVVANGAGLDAWLGDLLDQAGAEATRIDATRGVRLLPTGEQGFPGDPHVWHDPERAARMVDNVAAGLTRADPAGREAYRRNAAAYRARLERMAVAIQRLFASVPPERRKLVTTHDGFGYFARAYRVNVVGSVLGSAVSEPSARRLRRLAEAIRANGVRTIFTERAVDARLERRVAEEAGATVSSSLYADTLGSPGSGADGLVEAELADARAMRSAWAAP